MLKKQLQMGQYRSEVYSHTPKATTWSKHRNINPLLIWEFIICFNEIESALEWAFTKLFDSATDEFWMLVLGNMTYFQKCELWYKYLLRLLNVFMGASYPAKKAPRGFMKRKKKLEAKKKKLKRVLENLKAMGEFRNKVAHWFRAEQDEHGYIRTSNSKYWEEWVTIEYVKIINQDIRDNITKIWSLINFVNSSEVFFNE